jgi:hypothetical protein
MAVGGKNLPALLHENRKRYKTFPLLETVAGRDSSPACSLERKVVDADEHTRNLLFSKKESYYYESNL